MAAWAAEADRGGNLLFLAVPDEEANRPGRAAAAQALPALAARLGLELEAAINLDARSTMATARTGAQVALGTVGKLLPTALVVGRPAHAAERWAGVNAGGAGGRDRGERSSGRRS